MSREIQQTEGLLPGSLPARALQQNVQQNLHQTQQTNNVFVNQTLTPPATLIPSGGFFALLKTVPIKIENITKLSSDGTNFNVWDSDIKEFLEMIPGAVVYLEAMALPQEEGWDDNMARGVNSVIHWTVDRQLGMRLKELSAYPSVRMTHLRNLYSGETFANRLSIFQQIKNLVYDPSSSSLESHISRISGLRRRLEKSGMFLSDDVFAAFLAVGTPSSFPDIAQTFESTILADPKATISSVMITRALGAADISFRRSGVQSTEALAVNAKSQSDKEKLKCHYCKKKGHFQADCRKKKKDNDDKKSPAAKDVEVERVEAVDADIGFTGCVTISQIEVYQIGTNVIRWTVIFDTGATHHVFNDRRYFIDLQQIRPLAIKMANGSSSSFITAVGTVRVCNVMNESESFLVKNVYLC